MSPAASPQKFWKKLRTAHSPPPSETNVTTKSQNLLRRSCYTNPHALPRLRSRRLEAHLAHGRHSLALLLFPFPDLRRNRPHRISLPRLRQSDHPLRWPHIFWLDGPYHHDP